MRAHGQELPGPLRAHRPSASEQKNIAPIWREQRTTTAASLLTWWTDRRITFWTEPRVRCRKALCGSARSQALYETKRIFSKRNTSTSSHNSLVAVTTGTTVMVAVLLVFAISRNVLVTVTFFLASVSGCGERKS